MYGVKNPSTKSSLTIFSSQLGQIEYVCANPSDHGVAPGKAGQRNVILTDALTPNEIIDDKGHAVVKKTFNIPGPFACVNPNWTYLPESDATRQITANISWYACTGDPEKDPDPCHDGSTLTIASAPYVTVSGVCSIDPVQRNADGTVVLPQPCTCVQTPP